MQSQVQLCPPKADIKELNGTMTLSRTIARRARMALTALALSVPAVQAASDLDALDVENLRMEIATLPAPQRDMLRDSPERLREYLSGLLLDQRIESYAHA